MRRLDWLATMVVHCIVLSGVAGCHLNSETTFTDLYEQIHGTYWEEDDLQKKRLNLALDIGRTEDSPRLISVDHGHDGVWRIRDRERNEFGQVIIRDYTFEIWHPYATMEPAGYWEADDLADDFDRLVDVVGVYAEHQKYYEKLSTGHKVHLDSDGNHAQGMESLLSPIVNSMKQRLVQPAQNDPIHPAHMLEIIVRLFDSQIVYKE